MTAIAVLTMAWVTRISAATVAAPSPAPTDSIDLRGHAVCLDRANHRQDCRAGPHRFALEDREGRLHRFVATDELAGIFEDPRVRERDLLVRAREAASRALEIIKVFSVKDGKLSDLRYYCDVCHITAYVPGPCPCCGREMELVEEPLP
jgi:hypothetical protein